MHTVEVSSWKPGGLAATSRAQLARLRWLDHVLWHGVVHAFVLRVALERPQRCNGRSSAFLKRPALSLLVDPNAVAAVFAAVPAASVSL